MADRYTMGELLHLKLWRMDKDGIDYEVRPEGYERFMEVVEHTASTLLRFIDIITLDHVDVREAQ